MSVSWLDKAYPLINSTEISYFDWQMPMIIFKIGFPSYVDIDSLKHSPFLVILIFFNFGNHFIQIQATNWCRIIAEGYVKRWFWRRKIPQLCEDTICCSLQVRGVYTYCILNDNLKTCWLEDDLNLFKINCFHILMYERKVFNSSC